MRAESRGHMNAPKNANLPPNILVIDDDTTVAQGLEGPFKSYSIGVTKAKDLGQTLQAFEEEMFPPVVLVELEFEPMNGLVLVQRLRQHLKSTRRASGIILLTGKARNPTDDALVKELGDMESVVKPIKPINILPIISRALSNHAKLSNFEKFREEVLIEFAKTQKHIPLVERVKEKFGEYGNKAFQLAVELFENAHDGEAGLNFVKPFLQNDASNTLYLTAKAKFLMMTGNHLDARDSLEAAYKIAPLGLERLSLLEDAYLMNKEPKKAVEMMEKRVNYLKGNAESKFKMAGKLEDHGHIEEAKSFVRKHASPMEVVRYFNNMGVAMSQSGKHREAIASYEKALSYFPSSKENYRIYYNIALARIKMRSPQELALASTNLKKCLELSPDFEKAKTVLEQITMQKKAG